MLGKVSEKSRVGGGERRKRSSKRGERAGVGEKNVNTRIKILIR